MGRALWPEHVIIIVCNRAVLLAVKYGYYSSLQRGRMLQGLLEVFYRYSRWNYMHTADDVDTHVEGQETLAMALISLQMRSSWCRTGRGSISGCFSANNDQRRLTQSERKQSDLTA